MDRLNRNCERSYGNVYRREKWRRRKKKWIDEIECDTNIDDVSVQEMGDCINGVIGLEWLMTPGSWEYKAKRIY